VSKPVKRSVAVLIRNGDLILAVRRADNDDELPGIWGLPAGSFIGPESLEDLISRIGRQKLGVSLTPIRKLADGTQDRPTYRLQMDLWEVAMVGTPNHPSYQWTVVDSFRPGSELGSLCCELAIRVAG
jgi:ADP-ribose pyrophosphatase YjhB (NUDIX family)